MSNSCYLNLLYSEIYSPPSGKFTLTIKVDHPSDEMKTALRISKHLNFISFIVTNKS